MGHWIQCCTNFNLFNLILHFVLPSSFSLFAIFNPLAAMIGRPFFSHKSPAARASELFKPSVDSASLLVDIKKKKFFVFGGGFLEVTSQWGHVLEFWPPLAGPGPQHIGPFFWLKVLLTTIHIYRALDWLASISVAKIMGQKPSFWPNSKRFRKGIICLFRTNFGQPWLGSRLR